MSKDSQELKEYLNALIHKVCQQEQIPKEIFEMPIDPAYNTFSEAVHAYRKEKEAWLEELLRPAREKIFNDFLEKEGLK